MTDRWVPSGREFDEGAQSPLPSTRTSRRGRLLDRVLGRTRRNRPEIEVRPGVGEARMIVHTPPPAVEQTEHGISPVTSTGTAPDPVKSATQTRPASPPVEELPTPRRRARRQIVRPGIAPEIGPRPEGSDDGPVGSWPKDLTDTEMHRLIGPTQNYDDAT
jgi:hypothetical protein